MGVSSRIGIMGGTFNPIHTGHLLLAQTALSEAGLKQVMFLPSGQSYMKKAENILPAETRLKLVELAIADNPAFFLSDMEVRRKGNTYTCDTIKLLKAEQPDTEFYFIMGADSLFSMENWKNPKEIFDNCIILTGVRHGASSEQLQEKCEYLRKKYRAVLRLLPFPETAVSSTDIRRLLAEGKSIRYMVPEAVRLYIEENALYRQVK